MEPLGIWYAWATMPRKMSTARIPIVSDLIQSRSSDLLSPFFCLSLNSGLHDLGGDPRSGSRVPLDLGGSGLGGSPAHGVRGSRASPRFGLSIPPIFHTGPRPVREHRQHESGEDVH